VAQEPSARDPITNRTDARLYLEARIEARVRQQPKAEHLIHGRTRARRGDPALPA
jgi:hypothetical protein